ncbi:MAG: C25 family cysteine peptidase [Acidimicrobiales bacterium]
MSVAKRRHALVFLAAMQLTTVVAVVGLGVSPAGAVPGPEPVITFYVPLAEPDYINALRTGTGQPASIGTTARTTISITVASAGAVVYYDQWENGYEPVINDPVQVTGAGATQVWGDGNPANGDVTPFCSPSCPGDVIPPGGVITLNNSRRPGTTTPVSDTPAGIPLLGTPPALSRDPAELYWDGRDKIASNRGLAVSQAGWGDANALASGAVSAYDTSRFGTSFVIPLGTDSPLPVPNSTPTEYTGVSVMAQEDDTLVEIDANANGVLTDTVDVVTTLDQGETVLVNGGLVQAATIDASKPVQADLYVADVGPSYEVSFIELFPTNQFSTSYLAAAATYNANQSTVVYLFNPYTFLLPITVQTSSGTTTYTVAGRTAHPVILNTPLGGAALITAPQRFTATALVGANAPDTGSGNNTQDYDWGYAPLPVDFLTPSVVVGWAPAWQPGFTPDLNASPVWVTATVATTLYVDFDGDPSTGANITPLTGACDGVARYDSAIPITALQSRRITDTTADGSPFNDGIMTGARIFTCDGSLIAAAYGEDPNNAPVGTPGLDLGTAILPAAIVLAEKDWELVGDLDADGRVDPGDTVAWEIVANDAGSTALTNVTITDPLPAGVTYVSGSTTVDTGSGPVPVPDDAAPPAASEFPLDEGGYHLGTISPGGTVRVRFLVTINEPLNTLDGRVYNRATISSDQAEATTASDLPVQRPALDIVKTSDATGPLGPGDPLTYTLTITNNGSTTLAPVNVVDTFPSLLTWLSTSVARYTTVTAGTVADDLQCTTWSCSTGSIAWSQPSWQEQNDSLTAPIYNTGNVRNVADPSITTRAIRIGCTTGSCTTPVDTGLSRAVGNVTAAERVLLSVDVRCSGLDPGGDQVVLEARPDSSAVWQQLQLFDSGCNSSSYVTYSYELNPAAYLGTALELRFRVVAALEQNDLFYADNIVVTLQDRVPVTHPGSAPPNLVTIPDLLPGETATVTVSATVNTPLPPATFDIVNVATATSGSVSDADSATDCVICFDFGDAPDSYGTLYGSNGARARFVPGGPRLGSVIDREPEALAAPTPTSPATGDDLDQSPDDEDGVVINGGSGLAGGTTATIDLTLSGVSNVGAWVNGWFDFDNDGTFDPDESIFHPSRFVSATGGLTSLGFAPGPGTFTVTINVPDFGTNGSGFAIGDLIYSRFRVATAPGAVAAPTGASADGETEDFSVAITALPVELAWFSSRAGRNGVTVQWRTAQEIDNLGFRLYAGPGPERLEQLTPEVIPSLAPTSTGSQKYQAKVRSGVEQIWLEAIDLDGTTHLHGPFPVGGSWGDPTPPAPVDWQAVGAEVSAATPASPVVKITSRTTGPVANLSVDSPGWYRVSAADLAAAGVDLTGVSRSKLAITRSGQPVPIKVEGRGNRVGLDTTISFWGEPADTLYTGTAVYQLQLDKRLSRPIASDTTPTPTGPAQTSHLATVRAEEQRNYSVTAPGDDPWYDQLLTARGRPRSTTRTLEVTELATGQGDTRLAVRVWGISRFPTRDEHHVRVAVNGQPLADVRFDDAQAPTIEAAVPAGVLVEGANQVTVTLVGDTGVPLDMVALDHIEVTYPRRNVVTPAGLRLSSREGRVEVTGLDTAAVMVLRFDQSWQPAIVTSAEVRPDPAEPTRFTVAAPGGTDLVVVPDHAVKAPGVSAARPPADLLRGPADYLVITHSALRSSLGDLIAHHERQGRRVKVVDVADIYQSYGLVDAAAIDRYLVEAKRTLGVRWVLLVGADNYDYRDYDHDGSISLIPSPYGPVGLGGIRFAPLDPLYADVTGDGVPDVALGRLPARTPSELQTMIAKTLAYASGSLTPRALLASDQVDGLDLGSVNDSVATGLTGWSVDRADIGLSGVVGARTALLAGWSHSPALVSYIGHSGVRELGPAGFFATRDVPLVAGGRPSAVALYGCWNAYYVLPSADTLAHSLLLTPGGGAAAVMGGVTLTSATSDVMLLRETSSQFAANRGTFGEAVLAAKQRLARSHPGLAEIQLGWTMLGDPALPLPGVN